MAATRTRTPVTPLARAASLVDRAATLDPEADYFVGIREGRRISTHALVSGAQAATILERSPVPHLLVITKAR